MRHIRFHGMSESHHPVWRSIRSGYPLPPSGEIVWGWDGTGIHEVRFHDDDPVHGDYWTDLEDHEVGAISHWMPKEENPDQPPRTPNVWSIRHDGLSQPPTDAGFVWAFIGDEAPRRARYVDDHWQDLEGQPLDARSLKWLRELEFTDPARHP
jgi:hypothetical protein